MYLWRDPNRRTVRFIEAGFEFSEREIPKDYWRMPIEDFSFRHWSLDQFTMIPELAVAYKCGELSQAVLARSETRLMSCIKADPSSVNEKNVLGQTPLHLSAKWSWGTELLLANGARTDQLDMQRHPPIVYTCRQGGLASFQLLANAGSSFYYPPKGEACLFDFALSWYHCYPDESIEFIQELILTMAQRSARILQIANDVLYQDELSLLGGSQDRILDAKFGDAVILLERHGVTLPPDRTFCVVSETLYHADYLSADIASRLFEAGFRDIDVPDKFDRTPLMDISFRAISNPDISLLFAKWLTDHGADLYSRFGSSNARAIHLLAWGLGQSIDGSTSTCPLSEDAKQFLLDIFQDETGDGCKCKCSSRGCQGVTMALKGITQTFSKPYADEPSTSVKWLLAQIEHLGAYNTPSRAKHARKAIRFMTFEELGLTHSCCCRKRGIYWLNATHLQPMPEDDAREIFEEEKDLHDQLEILVPEFYSAYVRLGLPLPEFLEKHWMPRMDELSKQKPSKEELGRIRALGVRVKDSDDDSMTDGEAPILEEAFSEKGDLDEVATRCKHRYIMPGSTPVEDSLSRADDSAPKKSLSRRRNSV
ncbi:MAG: hypothetical protein M1820_010136 [Bogoriella megaspora]|nr:MAG: hypothetical protein M1820_010136 [Bogoriella megaspora]